jgi:hydrogenase maturation protein HypF
MQIDRKHERSGNTVARRRLLISGAVQGVGFRPFVYREAVRLGLSGWVQNSAMGVTVEVEGCTRRIADLVAMIRGAAPRPAQVRSLREKAVEPRMEIGFSIRESDETGARRTEVLPDLAACDACLAEMLEPDDRRFRYPFINCTQCGPRYSIVEAVPYDRSRTTMRRFAMCAACQAEYDDPSSRRFHAEPNACPDCGPQLSLWSPCGAVLAAGGEALGRAAAAIRDGAIVAVKGIGGFHLMADAGSETAIATLRRRKGRDAKPFAVMFEDVAAVRTACHLSPAAESLLASPERPIVLLPRLPRRGGRIAASVASHSRRLGALLPYAPLHVLLMRDLGCPAVATSGNLPDEPIVTDERVALRRLAGLADMLLVHDREIVRPIDDSIAHIVRGEPQVLRRARGFTPAPLAVRGMAPGLLAHGGHLKSTIAISAPAGVVLSQHLGDLESRSARESYAAALADLTRLTGVTPRIAVRDLHPDYASTLEAGGSGLPVVAVQHHVAHVAACLAEHGLEPPALGIAWDGTGYGPDRTIWGGECLHVGASGWRRVARLLPFRLPGGDRAVREPRRAALGLLHAAFGHAAFLKRELAPVRAFREAELQVLRKMLERGLNAPVTSSAGRLFDGAAALCGLLQKSSYEGQAAAEFEALAARGCRVGTYKFPVRAIAAEAGCLTIDWRPALAALVEDIGTGTKPADVSARFHAGLAAAIVTVARHVGEPCVALTGGCFQNIHLTETASRALERAGFRALWHRAVPPNDGGIALGQAAWASWMASTGESGCA